MTQLWTKFIAVLSAWRNFPSSDRSTQRPTDSTAAPRTASTTTRFDSDEKERMAGVSRRKGEKSMPVAGLIALAIFCWHFFSNFFGWLFR